MIAFAVLGGIGVVELPDVCVNPTRTGFIEMLIKMGGRVEYKDRKAVAGDTSATIVARKSKVRDAKVESADIPAMIDELPLLACVAAASRHYTRGATERESCASRKATGLRLLFATSVRSVSMRQSSRMASGSMGSGRCSRVRSRPRTITEWRWHSEYSVHFRETPSRWTIPTVCAFPTRILGRPRPAPEIATRPLKVLFIVTAYPRHDSDVITPWMGETIARLRKSGVEVEVLAPSYRGGATTGFKV